MVQMTDSQYTNAASSGIRLDKKTLKHLMRRGDLPGLRYLALWAMLLAASGLLLQLSFARGLWAILPAMILFGTLLTVPSYAISHECAHGTAFRSRWLNELVLWALSWLYLEGPNMRRYAHARHHSHTWMRGLDAQMPFQTPLTLKSWLLELSGLGQYLYDARHMLRNAAGRFDPQVVAFTPASELPKLKWEARIFILGYAAVAAWGVLGQTLLPVIYLLLPRLVGGVAMQLFTIIQHAEMAENDPDIRKSTRSFRTNRVGRFLYANMSWHVEHHLYPTVPFHALPALNAAVKDQLPQADRGLFATNRSVLRAVLLRAYRAKGKEALSTS